MPTVILSPIGGAGAQFFDNNGRVLNGGKLYTYESGTTSPVATYTDSSGEVERSNPIILDTAGRVSGEGVWLEYAVNYKLVLKDSADNTIATWDNVPNDQNAARVTTLQTTVSILQSSEVAIANCYAMAHMSGATQAISSFANTKVQYNTEDVDLGDNYDPTTYEFTVPASGVYQISAKLLLTYTTPTPGELAILYIYKNGSLFQIIDYSVTQSGTYTTLSGSITLQLDSSDIISLYVTTGVSSTVNIVAGTDQLVTFARII